MSARHITRVRRLYKLILRLHRNLPDDLRVLGDLYAKEEFKRHKKCKPQEARIFLFEWQDYAANMLRQAAPARAQGSPELGAAGGVAVNQEAEKPRFGNDLPIETVDRMTPDHLFNLYMLLVHASGENPHEPIDGGIDLLEVDTYANKVNKAKKYIIELEKIEKQKLARGELKEEDRTFQSDVWFKLFDIAVAGNDTVDEVISTAIERVENIKKGAEEAKKKTAQAKKEEKDTEINK